MAGDLQARRDRLAAAIVQVHGSFDIPPASGGAGRDDRPRVGAEGPRPQRHHDVLGRFRPLARGVRGRGVGRARRPRGRQEDRRHAEFQRQDHSRQHGGEPPARCHPERSGRDLSHTSPLIAPTCKALAAQVFGRRAVGRADDPEPMIVPASLLRQPDFPPRGVMAIGRTRRRRPGSGASRIRSAGLSAPDSKPTSPRDDETSRGLVEGRSLGPVERVAEDADLLRRLLFGGVLSRRRGEWEA